MLVIVTVYGLLNVFDQVEVVSMFLLVGLLLRHRGKGGDTAASTAFFVPAVGTS
jgi:hypothetical protein